MSRYRRVFKEGGCYFFTVVTHGREPILLKNIDRLRESFRYAREKRPFLVETMVVLPDHLHCIWQLPENDADFPNRWSLIKRYFSSGVDSPRTKRGEKHIWQRRFWEHLIRDDEDLRRHMDYIHYNPVRHGQVTCPRDWPFSSFLRAVSQGKYPADWGAAQCPVKDFETAE